MAEYSISGIEPLVNPKHLHNTLRDGYYAIQYKENETGCCYADIEYLASEVFHCCTSQAYKIVQKLRAFNLLVKIKKPGLRPLYKTVPYVDNFCRISVEKSGNSQGRAHTHARTYKSPNSESLNSKKTVCQEENKTVLDNPNEDAEAIREAIAASLAEAESLLPDSESTDHFRDVTKMIGYIAIDGPGAALTASGPMGKQPTAIIPDAPKKDVLPVLHNPAGEACCEEADRRYSAVVAVAAESAEGETNGRSRESSTVVVLLSHGKLLRENRDEATNMADHGIRGTQPRGGETTHRSAGDRVQPPKGNAHTDTLTEEERQGTQNDTQNRRSNHSCDRTSRHVVSTPETGCSDPQNVRGRQGSTKATNVGRLEEYGGIQPETEILTAYDVPPSLAADWIATYGTTRVQRVVTYMRQREAQGHRIRSHGGFVRRALEENWPIKLMDATPEAIAAKAAQRRREASKPIRIVESGTQAIIPDYEAQRTSAVALRQQLAWLKAGRSQQGGIGV